jgi:hypothetical protein
MELFESKLGIWLKLWLSRSGGFVVFGKDHNFFFELAIVPMH